MKDGILNRAINFDFEDYRDYRDYMNSFLYSFRIKDYKYDLAKYGLCIAHEYSDVITSLPEDKFNDKLRVINRNKKFNKILNNERQNFK